ncbi:MAG: DUF1643 domain-containing protein [Cyanobacteria bacterium]|nr:DUF1643 domain-containing protein [Cyanobacteriota bacterium]
MERTANFDETGRYRYCLTRCWRSDLPGLSIIMLNPSRADHQRDDPTLRRCIRLAQGWGYGGLTVVNLFAYCTAHPRELRQVRDPIGPHNDGYLRQVATLGEPLLLAWGDQGRWRDRDQAVLALLAPGRDLRYCLGINRTGTPRHPLYVAAATPLQPWPF